MSTPEPDRRRVDQLIAAAERVAAQPVPSARPTWLPMVGFAACVIGALLVGMAFAGGEHSTTTGPPATTQTTTVMTFAPTSTAVVITFPPNTTVPVGSTTTVTSEGPTTTSGYVANPLLPTRWVQYQAGVVHLEGDVPDQETADRLTSLFAATFGAANVATEYRVAPGAPLPATEPLYAHDAIQFAPNSLDLSPEAIAFLDLFAKFLNQNPTVTVDVNGYTDSTGPDDYNLSLSQSRVDAIELYLASKGVDPGRLNPVGYGEASPAGDNATEEGRAQNRRVELVLHGLLA